MYAYERERIPTHHGGVEERTAVCCLPVDQRAEAMLDVLESHLLE
ncbi:hypothetical protein [Streptomyces sp. SID10362]|nr:hypothetical protein [Streptomyces sp. SID10362]